MERSPFLIGKSSVMLGHWKHGYVRLCCSRDPRRLAVPSHVLAMSYSPPRTPINPRGFAIVAKLVSKETLNTATAKVASLETSVWHFGRTVGLPSVQRDQRDGKEYDELLSGYYFKYGKRVWKADDHPELTFWQAGMRAGGVVEYHGIQPGGEMQVTEIKRKRAFDFCCFKDVLGKVCPCSWWILMDDGSWWTASHQNGVQWKSLLTLAP